MRNRMDGDGQTGAGSHRGAGRGKSGWGGRRHRLAGDGQNQRITVTLTHGDSQILGKLRGEMGSVTERNRMAGGESVTVDGLERDGLPSSAAVIRWAIRVLAERLEDGQAEK